MDAQRPQKAKTLTKREGSKFRLRQYKMWAAQSGGEDCAAARMEENVKRFGPAAAGRPTRGTGSMRREPDEKAARGKPIA